MNNQLWLEPCNQKLKQLRAVPWTCGLETWDSIESAASCKILVLGPCLDRVKLH